MMSAINNQSPANNSVIYSVTNVHETLVPSSLDGVMQLPTGSVIRVEAARWKNCLDEINEACSYGWNTINSNKQPTDLTPEQAQELNISLSFSAQYGCHRSGKYVSVAKDRPIQKKSKKVGCKCTLRVRSYYARPEYYELVIEKDHTNHVPGDILDDIRTLRLPKDRLHEILQQIKHSSKTPRQIRIDMLKAADSYGRKSHRKVNYHDIWNIMNKVSC
jgi:hypothetical protein